MTVLPRRIENARPMNRAFRAFSLLACVIFGRSAVHAADFSLQTPLLNKTATFESLLLASDVELLAKEARRRGDAERGALVFYTSAAACVQCHGSDGAESPLGPNLAKMGTDTSDKHIVESLLYPSREIKKGFETISVLTVDGQIFRGMRVREDDRQLIVRDAHDLSEPVSILREDIEQVTTAKTSMMPEGLVPTLGGQRAFYDLLAYLFEISEGGTARAESLKPSDEALQAADDSDNLDHAGIIAGLGSRDFAAGESIFHGYCVSCHGADGNQPSLSTARAFGTEKLKFGSDPYSMFLTLTRGNGLMGPMSHLLPKERYQVAHYIREAFMKSNNPDYFTVDEAYLRGLPKGTDQGDSLPRVERDYGPALASQLRRDFESVLTVRLPKLQGEPPEPLTVSYDLHSMNQAAIWSGGFLDLDHTQHMRPRGEGTANPGGTEIAGLAGWQWGHEQTFDYSRDEVLPRGPLPQRWLDYRGHYLYEDQTVFHYRIDGREIYELPHQHAVAGADHAMQHVLRIAPGEPLTLAVAQGTDAASPRDAIAAGGVSLAGADISRAPAQGAVAYLSQRSADGELDWTAATVGGDTAGLAWEIDEQRRIVLHIPPADETRLLTVERATGRGRSNLETASQRSAADSPRIDPATRTSGGTLRWPDILSTTGYRGLQQGAYVLDTITIPESTPWNTWFRTSAIDFFPDGRMVVATYGGDIWIVSGVDDDLLELRWKRFAGGLYEPFGVKVVDGDIYVTCKDRVTRLHDRNRDGEADFYETFSPETDVSVNFHAFNFDLQTDSRGNFYYAKSGHGADFALPGAVIEISPDGEQRRIYCTGFRSPNGMGVLPDDRLTVSDNQGQWMPASKINLIRRGGFYGWVPTYSLKGMWAPDGGELDLSTVEPPENFDPPLVWMPQDFDNSSGGQVWAGDPRWGPLADHLLHTSFGKGWMSYLAIQDFDDISQAAIIKLPFDFQTGIMRARVNPADGQVYATGLDGWNGGGRIGMGDKGIQRLRYTGRPEQFITDCRVGDRELRISFTQPLDQGSARDIEAYTATHWNYKWRASYGSDMYSPVTGEEGVDALEIESASLDASGKQLTLRIPGLRPVDQLRLQMDLRNRDATRFSEEVFWTIHRVPSQRH